MNVSLTPTLEKMVKEKVSSGMYNSASEVIREALRIMALTEKANTAKLAALREDLEVGIRQLDNGQFEEYNADSAHKLIDRFRSKRK
ncbi:MAG: type II toxin-antitoxin system ParD family antitoxin [Deltaproteobacteria bacterium]|nr:type II toxin-antitoxin system ParD family antitoxin [Deltaproteobacteria bacterium]